MPAHKKQKIVMYVICIPIFEMSVNQMHSSCVMYAQCLHCTSCIPDGADCRSSPLCSVGWEKG